ncbi:MAG: LPS assembly lipoprotein LptE [Rikenellaceae bacterium]|nr:LPS assembly lipoprotein LptE [Rikenellaceae bacterium]
MTAIIRKIVFTLGLTGLFFLFSGLGCRVSYTLSGASIHPDARTVSIAYFPNNAPLVATILSPTFTDALQEKFVSQTRLSLVQEEGDLDFEGEIVGYTSTPTAVTASNDFPAAMNRLTITVRVRFKNRLEPEYDFNRTFSHYVDYDSNLTLQSMEGELIPEIVTMLVDDIYMAAGSNW